MPGGRQRKLISTISKVTLRAFPLALRCSRWLKRRLCIPPFGCEQVAARAALRLLLACSRWEAFHLAWLSETPIAQAFGPKGGSQETPPIWPLKN